MCNIRISSALVVPNHKSAGHTVTEPLPAVHYVHRCVHTHVSAHKEGTEQKSVVIIKYSVSAEMKIALWYIIERGFIIAE